MILYDKLQTYKLQVDISLGYQVTLNNVENGLEAVML